MTIVGTSIIKHLFHEYLCNSLNFRPFDLGQQFRMSARHLE